MSAFMAVPLINTFLSLPLKFGKIALDILELDVLLV